MLGGLLDLHCGVVHVEGWWNHHQTSCSGWKDYLAGEMRSLASSGSMILSRIQDGEGLGTGESLAEVGCSLGCSLVCLLGCLLGRNELM